MRNREIQARAGSEPSLTATSNSVSVGGAEAVDAAQDSERSVIPASFGTFWLKMMCIRGW
ncbi:hypothetical protein GN244_ATG05223 [Phytophthora infestans]|uniref:Uncharacterized protein n=1 Tax=Phytophthora infestans TaxID=4787 RepID=A0A833W508_PHYIN|nr:hypothetical protein GN244_ATG05223 [Phytophthora infestans]KAF4150606.1 hypothetical protein GN958_ATG00268 [Phytophthora infestans]